MADNTINNEQILEGLKHIANNPGEVIEYAYNILETATDGTLKVPNPTNPFSYTLEMAAMEAVGLHNNHEATYREQYPKLATEYKHLYNHMFDEHYIGRFATAGRADFDIYFKKNEVISNLVNTDVVGIRKMIIPRGSYITIQDYVFTLLYNIEISQLAHGGLQILYRTSQSDPVQQLNSNIVNWDYVFVNGIEYIRIRPRLLNVKLIQIQDNLLQTYGYRERWKLKGHYSHCRVYQVKQNGTIEELTTTHSDLIYDAEKVTAKLQYSDNELMVEIPQIYFNKGMTGIQIIVEIYTTDGEVEEPLTEYTPDSFTYQWGKLENNTEDLRYVTPIELLSQPIIQARTMLQGGRNVETFEKTRERVINFANYSKTPITPNQLVTTLEVDGYDVVKARDTLTQRIYYATRALPKNKYDTFTKGAACAMETVKTTLAELAVLSGVRNNGKRMTITPDVLFKTDLEADGSRGIVTVVHDSQIPKLDSLGMETYLGKINQLEYMFTPFYYVLDTTGNNFDMRAYYFNKPEIRNQIFIANNATSGYSVSSDEMVIIPYKEKNEEGFILRVKTRATEEYETLPYDKLFCQLAIQPIGDKSYAYINGVLLGVGTDPETEIDEYVWEFRLKTKWDVTSRHGIMIHDMKMHIDEFRKYEIPLEGDFHFIYGVKDTPIKGFQPDVVDKMINKEIIPTDDDIFVGITYDKASYQLGVHLRRFWSNGITIQDGVKYRRYEADVPRVYKRDVYDISPDGNFVLEDNDLVILHRAGDPVLDDNGQPILYARKGDVVLDKRGLPIIEEDRNLARLLDIMMIDGIYYFATDENDMKYRSLIADTVKDWIRNDLEEISDRLLENTSLFFYPKRTMGNAKLIVDSGIELQQPMRLSFVVNYYLHETSYNNFDIREAIRQTTYKVINEQLENENVSTSDIITELRNRGGEDIVAVNINDLGSRFQFTTFTTKDPSVRCSVKRLLKMQPDRTLKVVEDIEVNFIKHESSEQLRVIN